MTAKFYLLTIFLIFSLVQNAKFTNEMHFRNMTQISAQYDKWYNVTLNSTTEYIYVYRNNIEIFPVRVILISKTVTEENNLMIVGQQKHGITSWQMPMDNEFRVQFQKETYSAHTLCPESLLLFQKTTTQSVAKKKLNPEQCSNPTVHIKTPSDKNVDYSLKVVVQRNFFIKAKQDYQNVRVTESEPVYFYYNFNDYTNMANESEAVLVTATSHSNTCLLFSIQNSSCPVLDLENNIKYDSYWQTMSRKAAMVVLKKHYPYGFFIVMVVKHDDLECDELIRSDEFNIFTQSIKREKIVTLNVSPTISLEEHLMTANITLAIFAVLLLLAIIGGVIFYVKIVRDAQKHISSGENPVGMLDCRENLTWTNLFKLSFNTAAANASNYVWLVTIIILFYILPVLQVVVTYQGIVNETGNDDICYYNFLCALPYRIFGMHVSDFNHVLSNIGYMFLGIVFIMLTFFNSIKELTRQKRGFGLVKPYGMYYSLGIALIMEGVMSACYHICPKKSNFQFDTSFMYVMTVLMICNVYETRKADVGNRTRDERGYIVFFSLAGVTAISVIGSYAGTKLWFWIVITILHILMCMLITYSIEFTYIRQIFKKGKVKELGNPIDIIHGLLLFLINGANVGLAIFGLIMKYSFATHVLTVLISNGVLYTMFYIIMKVCHKEKISVQTPILIVLSVACWVPALYFFLTTVTTWEETPAQSRNRNQDCLLVRYYDSHDIWHFLSAFALFFTCWILLTLDEGLDQIPRNDIVDFHGEKKLPGPKINLENPRLSESNRELNGSAENILNGSRNGLNTVNGGSVERLNVPENESNGLDEGDIPRQSVYDNADANGSREIVNYK